MSGSKHTPCAACPIGRLAKGASALFLRRIVFTVFRLFMLPLLPVDASVHAYMMRQAMREADAALALGEVPVGAVVAIGQRIIARTHNLTERLKDVTAHAEIQAIGAAANTINGKYLPECTLYVTLEPCVMCAGALYWAQLGMVVFGASDAVRGYQAAGLSLHPKTEVLGGILADECGEMVKAFFRGKRKGRF